MAQNVITQGDSNWKDPSGKDIADKNPSKLHFMYKWNSETFVCWCVPFMFRPHCKSYCFDLMQLCVWKNNRPRLIEMTECTEKWMVPGHAIFRWTQNSKRRILGDIFKMFFFWKENLDWCNLSSRSDHSRWFLRCPMAMVLMTLRHEKELHQVASLWHTCWRLYWLFKPLILQCRNTATKSSVRTDHYARRLPGQSAVSGRSNQCLWVQRWIQGGPEASSPKFGAPKCFPKFCNLTSGSGFRDGHREALRACLPKRFLPFLADFVYFAVLSIGFRDSNWNQYLQGRIWDFGICVWDFSHQYGLRCWQIINRN